MISKISSIGVNTSNLVNNRVPKNNQTNPIKKNENYKQDAEILGVPYSYISFKGVEDKKIKYNPKAQELIDKAKDLAFEFSHNEITPYHIIQVAIQEHFLALIDDSRDEEIVNEGEPISILHAFFNQIVGRNLLEDESEMLALLNTIQYLSEANTANIDKIEKAENVDRNSIKFSADIMEQINESELEEFSPTALVGVAFNTLTHKGIGYPSECLLSLMSLNMYKTQSKIDENYLSVYDSRAIDAWNKLALGSNLFITSKNSEERERLEASIVNTIDEKKHGNFNSDNTYIYCISDDANVKSLIENIKKIKNDYSDKNLLFILDMDAVIEKLVSINATGAPEVDPALFELAEIADENAKFILFQDENTYYTLMMTPAVKKQYSNFINYTIPPIHSHEVGDILKKNKDLLKEVKKPFTPDAREKAILLAEKMEGSYPEKAVNIMKRIAGYYGETVKKITSKEVDEFAYIAQELFNNDETNNSIIYNTGKTLADYYGKETTKKDIEALVRQIKSGRAGTQGLIITSEDNEAGSGKKHTAKVIAGEAKVPFMELTSSDFAISSYDTDMSSRIPPANLMNKLFTELKNAAKQNQHRSAVLYINDFDDFAISNSYYLGYKQATAQLIKEMEKAVEEDVSIIVIGGSNSEIAPYIPMFIKDFKQNIVVDSPAFNKKSRDEIVRHFIEQKQLPLQYRTLKDKENLINKLVKMSEYMSYAEIKNLISKAEHIMLERNKKKAGIGEFIEAYLQIATGRTSLPQMPDYNKALVTSHECGHATNLEIMNKVYREKGQPWFEQREVNFITLDPRGNFLGAVFEGRTDNQVYTFESMFSNIVCSYGGHSCEKRFFDIDGSAGISSDLAQATSAAKQGIEFYGLGHHTGKISNAANIKSGEYAETVHKDTEIILAGALLVSDLITEYYAGFNKWFTQKYSKLIGSDNCMLDGEDFRKELNAWIASQSQKVKEELDVVSDLIMDIIKDTKQGKMTVHVKKAAKKIK